MVLRSFGRERRRFGGATGPWALAAVLVAAPLAFAQPAQPNAQAADPNANLIRIPLTSLCQLAVIDGQLVFTSRVPIMTARGGRWRDIDVPGLPGDTQVLYSRGALQLENSFLDRDGTSVSLTIRRERGLFELNRRVSGRGTSRSMSLSQSYTDDGTFRGGSGRLTLTVNGRTVAAADDFETLRRDNPGPFYADVVPALRQLGGGALLEVDPWAARQVLADRIAPDDLPGAVKRLVEDLRDPAAKTREAAIVRLAALGQPAADELKRLDREELSPQQSVAVEVLLKKHRPLAPADADRLRDDANFLVDCLYSEDTDIPPAALARLKELTGREWRPDLANKVAERGDVIEKLRASVRKFAPATKPATLPAE